MAEAMIESTDDMVCGVEVDAFAAPNSASVLYIPKWDFFSSKIYKENDTWKTSILMAFMDTISVIKAYAIAG